MDAVSTVDPRLSQDLIDLLDAHEVPHDSDALLWEIEKRGGEIVLEGPDAMVDIPEYRWTLRIFSGGGVTNSAWHDREVVQGQTNRIALARAFQWLVHREAAGTL